MSSREGFPRADVDVGYYHDPKAVALARLQRDPIRTLATLGLHQAAVLASWREARRISVADALPAWLLEDVAPLVADLVTVGLVDPDGRISEHAFDAWIGPAIDSRETYRAAGRRGAQKRWDSGATSGANGGANGPLDGGQMPLNEHLNAGLPASTAGRPADVAPALADAREGDDGDAIAAAREAARRSVPPIATSRRNGR